MSSSVIQIFRRPSANEFNIIEHSVGYLNLRRWRAFDTGMVELTKVKEASDQTIAIKFTYTNSRGRMLPGNRMAMTDWTRLIDSLVHLHGPPLPLGGSNQSFGYKWSVSEGETLTEDQDRNQSTNDEEKKTCTPRLAYNFAMELFRKGEEIACVQAQTGLAMTTLKRIRNQADGLVPMRITIDDLIDPLMKVNEHGQSMGLLTIQDQRQLVDLLRAGIPYRDVAAMFSVSAWDVRLLAIEPTEASV